MRGIESGGYTFKNEHEKDFTPLKKRKKRDRRGIIGIEEKLKGKPAESWILEDKLVELRVKLEELNEKLKAKGA